MKTIDISKKQMYIKNCTLFVAYLFVVWGFYRLLFQAPEPLDDLIFKPFVWLLPLVFILKKEKLGLPSIGVTGKRLTVAIYISLILGFIFSLQGAVLNFIKYEGFEFQSNIGFQTLLLGLITTSVAAISEELVFRGYVYGRLTTLFKKDWVAIAISTLCWVAIHIPVAIFDWRLSFVALLQYLLLITTFGIAAGVLYSKVRNIAAPILLHILWAWPVILFR